MQSTGIRDLKDNLSRFIARASRGEHVLITDRGRVVAALGPPPVANFGERYAAMVAAGQILPPRAPRDPDFQWPRVKLPKGTAAALIDADRDER